MKINIVLLYIIFSFYYSTKIHYSDDNFKYIFEITSRKIKEKKDVKYYWYKSGKIHRTFGGYFGNLLSGDFIKLYLDNQLAEKGKFNNGVKQGIWKQWYNNGNLKEIIFWKNGKKNGKFLMYNDEGKLILKGKFKNNLKHGVWINYNIKDTMMFKKGLKIIKKQKAKKTKKNRKH